MPNPFLSAALVFAYASAGIAQTAADAFVAKIPSANIASSVTISAATTGASAGHSVDAAITLAASKTPASFQIDVVFDPQVLTFVSARAGDQLVSAGKGLIGTVLSDSSVRLTLTGTNQNVIANGVVAYVTFALSAKFGASTPLTFANCMSASATGGALSTGCMPSTIVAFTCDIDGDGAATVADVQSIVNQALGLTPASSDSNHDGVVNVADIQKVIDSLIGLGCVY